MITTKKLIWGYALLLMIACHAQPVEEETTAGTSRREAVKSTATSFFATYAERSDWGENC